MDDLIRETIHLAPYFRDHCLGQRPVLPAVEALQILSSKLVDPKEALSSSQAEFLRFLYLPDESDLEVLLNLSNREDGKIQTALLTEVRTKVGNMIRHKEHVTVRFGDGEEIQTPPHDLLGAPEGLGLKIDPPRLYDELVPFGPAFRNISGPVYITTGGACGQVTAPNIDTVPGPLGSPFPMDAAFHLACVWGQRFHGIVGFPVGYGRRRIYVPTESGNTYHAHVFPKGRHREIMIYDVWLTDGLGQAVEAVIDLQMRDVSGGKDRPPDWVLAPESDPLEQIRMELAGLAVIEQDALAPFAENVFSPREQHRTASMGDRRKKSFTSVRVALKQLARKLGYAAAHVAADKLDTLADDDVRPILPGGRYCSAAHDGRFTIVVSAEVPVGVDVEIVGDKPIRGARLYMSDSEQSFLASSGLNEQSAAVRVWTIKEAAAKALNVNLAEAWARVEVAAIGDQDSPVRIDRRKLIAHHADIDGHVITVLTIPGEV